MSQMHQRYKGYPFGFLIDFAPDAMGHPIFSFLELGIHTRKLLTDPRYLDGVVCQMQGLQFSVMFPPYGISPTGFGADAWVNVKEYESIQPDEIAVNSTEQNIKFNIHRLLFEEWDGTKTVEEAKQRLWNLVNRGDIQN
ncbi:hypothetical protein R6Q59_015853 [Mikania micrantha]